MKLLNYRVFPRPREFKLKHVIVPGAAERLPTLIHQRVKLSSSLDKVTPSPHAVVVPVYSLFCLGQCSLQTTPLHFRRPLGQLPLHHLVLKPVYSTPASLDHREEQWSVSGAASRSPIFFL
jgi:hypothetical protein